MDVAGKKLVLIGGAGLIGRTRSMRTFVRMRVRY